MIWVAVLGTAVGCYALKLSGWLVPAAWLAQPHLRAAAALLPIALLSGLIVVQVFSRGQQIVLDPRAAALGAGALCLWRRLPFLVVVVVAAATAAAVRAS